MIDLVDLLEREGATLAQDIRDAVPVASGELKESIDHDVTSSGNIASLTIEAAEQAGWVERGRKKGRMPPITPIKEWLMAIGKDPRAAFAVALGIKRNGIRPRPFLKNAIARSEPDIRAKIERVFGEAVKIEGENLIRRTFPGAK